MQGGARREGPAPSVVSDRGRLACAVQTDDEVDSEEDQQAHPEHWEEQAHGRRAIEVRSDAPRLLDSEEPGPSATRDRE